jgi:threonine/homoserine/homoserine lactone efflux protein
MPELNTLLLFVLAATPLCLAPGPGMLYVLSRAATQGPRAGIVSALGLSIGTLIHVASLALGLAALLARVPLAYDALRFGGAAYLIYVGIQMWRSPGAPANAAAAEPIPPGRLFAQGILTGTLNPKVALFLLAFLPQFVDPRRGSTALQIVILGVLFELMGSAVNWSVAFGAGAASRWLRPGSRAQTWVGRSAGAVCVGLGLRLALAERR